MTHSPDFGADFWTLCHSDLVPDFSGTRFWRRSAPIGCVFYFVPISGMHVPLRRPMIERNVLCTMSWLLITIAGIDEMDSSIFASSMLIFGADFSAASFGADFWSVCHQLNSVL